MILGGQQGADVPFEDKVRLPCALDRLDDLGVRRVRQIPNLATDGLLPSGQRLDVGIHAGIGGVGQRRTSSDSLRPRRPGSYRAADNEARPTGPPERRDNFAAGTCTQGVALVPDPSLSDRREGGAASPVAMRTASDARHRVDDDLHVHEDRGRRGGKV